MKYKTQKYLPKYLCPIYYFLFDVRNNVKTKRPSQHRPSVWSVHIHQLGNKIGIEARGPPLPMLHLVTSQTLSLGTVHIRMQWGTETQDTQRELTAIP